MTCAKEFGKTSQSRVEITRSLHAWLAFRQGWNDSVTDWSWRKRDPHFTIR